MYSSSLRATLFDHREEVEVSGKDSDLGNSESNGSLGDGPDGPDGPDGLVETFKRVTSHWQKAVYMYIRATVGWHVP